MRELRPELRIFVGLAAIVLIVAVAGYSLSVINYGEYSGLLAIAVTLLIFVLAEHRFDGLGRRFDRMEKCCEELSSKLDAVEKMIDLWDRKTDTAKG